MFGPFLKPAPALPNKPLLEVIFELRWQITESPQPGFGRDPGFSILHGRYYDFARKNGYPEVVSLSTSQLPDDMAPYVPRYQFWAAPKQWPVTQIGPGIMTVNSTKEYKWESFFPKIQEALNALTTSYPTEINKFIPLQISLKYIDIIPYDVKGNLPEFLRNNFHTDIKIKNDVFSEEKESSMDSIKLNLNYKINNPKGDGKINIGNGTYDNKPIIGWDTEIKSAGKEMPVTLEEFNMWLESAHDLSKKWFYALTDGPLLKSFQEEVNAKN